MASRKTLAVNVALLLALALLLYKCSTGEVWAALDANSYMPTANQIYSQCEQIHSNPAELDKCLAAYREAKK